MPFDPIHYKPSASRSSKSHRRRSPSATASLTERTRQAQGTIVYEDSYYPPSDPNATSLEGIAKRIQEQTKDSLKQIQKVLRRDSQALEEATNSNVQPYLDAQNKMQGSAQTVYQTLSNPAAVGSRGLDLVSTEQQFAPPQPQAFASSSNSVPPPPTPAARPASPRGNYLASIQPGSSINTKQMARSLGTEQKTISTYLSGRNDLVERRGNHYYKR